MSHVVRCACGHSWVGSGPPAGSLCPGCGKPAVGAATEPTVTAVVSPLAPADATDPGPSGEQAGASGRGDSKATGPIRPAGGWRAQFESTRVRPNDSSKTDQPPARRLSLDTDGMDSLAPQLSEYAPKPVGVIGRYELLSELGRGGMGVVYKARDTQLNRIVALKMILGRVSATDTELIRFRREAEVVAALQHPNIVQIFEVGENDGQPFCVLELLPGGTLSDVVKAGNIPVRKAAEYIEILARAVGAAHTRGVIHRDLKPGNVLFTAGGAPKVTDFGLAKLLDDEQSQTRDGDVLGTPTYMAPEQAAGRLNEMGPPADIYALGVMLYEMLVDKLPIKGPTALDTLQMLQTVEPPPPRQVKPAVPVDLETIALKCLQKQPGRRYASTTELADDLRRWLDGEPILARPVSVTERLVLWCRKRPSTAGLIGVSAAAVLFLAVAGPMLAWREAARAGVERGLREAAEQEKTRAEQEKARAEQEQARAVAQERLAEANYREARAAVELMLTRVAEERLANEPHLERVRRDLLTEALRFYERFLGREPTDPGVRWELARAQIRVGDIQDLLGDRVKAAAAHAGAVTLLTALADEFPENQDYRRDLAACLTNQADGLAKAGQLKDAEAGHRRALELRTAVAAGGAFPDRLAQGESHNNLGTVLQQLERYPEAEHEYRAALLAYEGVAAEPGHAIIAVRRRADTAGNLANLLQKAGRPREAVPLREAAVAALARAAEGRQEPPIRHELGAAYHELGVLHQDQDAAKAEAAYKDAIRVRAELVSDFPMVPVYRQTLAASYQNLSVTLQAAGRPDDAEVAARQARALKEKLADELPGVPGFQLELARAAVNRGILAQQRGRLTEAESEYRQAARRLAALTSAHPDAPLYRREWATAQQNLAVVLQSRGATAEAETLIGEVLAVRHQLAAKPGLVADAYALADCQLQRGGICALNGKPAQAEEAYRQSLAGLRKLVDSHPGVADYRQQLGTVQLNLSTVLQTLEKPSEAEQAARAAVAAFEALNAAKTGAAVHPLLLARSLNTIGVLLATRKRTDDAFDAWDRAVELLDEIEKRFPGQPDTARELANVLVNQGKAFAQVNRTEAAVTRLTRAAGLLEAIVAGQPNVPAGWQELFAVRTNVVALNARAGHLREADDAQQALVEARRRRLALTPDDPPLTFDLAQALGQLGDLRRRRHADSEAAEAFAESLKHLWTVRCTGWRADACLSAQVAVTLAYADVLMRTDQYRRAAAVVGEVACSVPGSTPGLSTAAVILAECSRRAETDAKLSTARRTALAREYAGFSLSVLRSAAEGNRPALVHALEQVKPGPLTRLPGFASLRQAVSAPAQPTAIPSPQLSRSHERPRSPTPVNDGRRCATPG